MSRLRVTVVWPSAGATAIAGVELPPGATVADAVAVAAVGAAAAAPGLAVAIHGQSATGDTPVRDGDRVEVTRPLVADARALRRQRAAARQAAGPAPARRRRPGL